MDRLPAYVALQPWANGRRVLVVAPHDLDGARVLRHGGAAYVRIVEGPRVREPGIDGTAGWPEPHERFDLVVVVETYAERGADVRRRWLQHAASALMPDGWLAARAPHDGRSDVDFWTLEEELGERFPHVYMLAQLPWYGVSLAPVLDDDLGPTHLELDESLVELEPDASHYLALATMTPPSEEARRWATGRCLLVPSATSSARPSVSDEELVALRRALEDARTLAA